MGQTQPVARALRLHSHTNDIKSDLVGCIHSGYLKISRLTAKYVQKCRSPLLACSRTCASSSSHLHSCLTLAASLAPAFSCLPSPAMFLSEAVSILFVAFVRGPTLLRHRHDYVRHVSHRRSELHPLACSRGYRHHPQSFSDLQWCPSCFSAVTLYGLGRLLHWPAQWVLVVFLEVSFPRLSLTWLSSLALRLRLH